MSFYDNGFVWFILIVVSFTQCEANLELEKRIVKLESSSGCSCEVK